MSVLPHNILLYSEAGTTGGVTEVIETLVRSLHPSFTITVIHRDTEELRQWASALPEGVRSFPYALRNLSELFGWLEIRNLIRLYGIFRRASIVHFHLHSVFSCMPAIFLAKVMGIRVALSTEHYVAQIRFLRRRNLPLPLVILREIKIYFLMMWKRLSLRTLNLIVTVSDANKNFMREVFGNDIEKKIVTIPNGIAVGQYLSLDRERIQMRKDLHWVEDQLVVVVVAGLNRQKGHDDLIKAIPQIAARVPNARFVFVGEGHLREYLEGLVRQLRIAEIVDFVGKRGDVARILAASDLFVLPSLFEGMPLSVIEAMAAGRAVVATNVDGTAEIVEDGKTGFLVPPKDSRALASKIVELLLDTRLREEFGRWGRERAFKRFNKETMVKQYSDTYERLPITRVAEQTHERINA